MYSDVLTATKKNSKISKYKYYKFINSFFTKTDKSILHKIPLDYLISTFTNQRAYANYVTKDNKDIIPMIFRFSLNHVIKFDYYASIDISKNKVIRKFKDLTISLNMKYEKEVIMFIYENIVEKDNANYAFDYIISNYFFKENLYDKTFILNEKNIIIGYYIEHMPKGSFLFELYPKMNILNKALFMINFFFNLYLLLKSNFDFYDIDLRTVYILDDMEQSLCIITKKVNLSKKEKKGNYKYYLTSLLKMFILLFETDDNCYDSYADNISHHNTDLLKHKDDVIEILNNIYYSKLGFNSKEANDIISCFIKLLNNCENKQYPFCNFDINSFLFFITKTYKILLDKNKQNEGNILIKSSYIDLITPVIDNQIKNQTNEQFSSNQFNSNNIIVYVSSFKYITKCSQVIALQYISNKENEHRKYNLINVKDCKTLYDYQKLIKAIETLYTQSIDAIANKKYKETEEILNEIIPRYEEIYKEFIYDDSDQDSIRQYNAMIEYKAIMYFMKIELNSKDNKEKEQWLSKFSFLLSSSKANANCLNNILNTIIKIDKEAQKSIIIQLYDQLIGLYQRESNTEKVTEYQNKKNTYK